MKKLLAMFCGMILTASMAFASQPVFNGQYEITGVDGNTNTGWQLTGKFEDGSLSGWTAADCPTNARIFSYSGYGDVDKYRVTNIVVAAGLTLTVDVIYDETGTPRNGAPSPGYQIIIGPGADGVVYEIPTIGRLSELLQNYARNLTLKYAIAYAATSGVSSISSTSAVTGAITFSGNGVTQTGTVFNFSGGGGGAGNITNLISSDGSVVITAPGGPQPDLSVTGYVAGVMGGISNDVDVLKGKTSGWDQASSDASAATNFLGTNTVQAQIDGKVGTNDAPYTNAVSLSSTAVQRTGDTNIIDLTSADCITIPASCYSNSPVTQQELNDGLESTSIVTLYGDTNAHLVITGAGSLTREVPAIAWAITNVLDDGTNIVGTYWLTNTTERIRGGPYAGRFYAIKASGNSTVNAKIELLYSDDNGATTNIIGSPSAVSGPIASALTSYRVITSNPDDITNSALYLGVRYILVRTGGANATVVTYGGDPYDTHLETPGIGVVVGYLTSERDPHWAGHSNDVVSHLTNTSNPHEVTADQVGAVGTNDFADHEANLIVDVLHLTAAEKVIATNDLSGRVSGLEGATGSYYLASNPDGFIAGLLKSGNTATTQGKIYQQLADGTWQLAVNTNVAFCNKAIGIAYGTNSTSAGMVVLGQITVTNNNLQIGSNIYVNATAGEFTQVIPTANGSVIRAIGWAKNTNEIYVTPSPVWVEVGELISGNVNFNTFNATNIGTLAVTALQVTGGSPTNGAVFQATNTAGQGAWSAPVGFLGVLNTVQFSNNIAVVVTSSSNSYNYGNNYDSNTFVAPVNGLYSFTLLLHIYPQKGGHTTSHIYVNNVKKRTVQTEVPLTVASYSCVPAMLQIYLTNGSPVTAEINTLGTNTLFSGLDRSTFEGHLIRELP